MAASLSPALAQQFDAGRQALAAGSALQAQGLLELVVRQAPDYAPGRQMLGLSLAMLGDGPGAERELRQAIALDKRHPSGHTSLGDLMAVLNQPTEAERAFRAALAIDRRFQAAAEGLSRLLILQGRGEEAAQVIHPLAILPSAPAEVLEIQVRALYSAGRLEEALVASRRAAATGVANAGVGTAQLLSETGRQSEAEAAFRAILATQPDEERARRGLARAVFAQTDDMDAALTALGEDGASGLIAYRARLLNHAGRSAEALAYVEAALRGRKDDPVLHAAAATAAALAGEPDAALRHADAAVSLAPKVAELRVLLIQACLAAGEIGQAAGLVGEQRQAAPFDQTLIALQAVAFRLLGDERYGALYDYDRFVQTFTLEPPKGWTSLGAFLAELAAHFHAAHAGMSEPLDQSVRGGSQTRGNLIQAKEPLVDALFAALDRPVAAFADSLGHSGDALADPFAARNTGGHAYRAAWSVRLRPGGRHVNHIHAGGWISSAFHIDLPDAGGADSRDGWLQFGEPGIPTRVPLPAQHVVKPQPGTLVLFPSYMWHGTTPFAGPQPRLSFAFDVVPAAERGRPSKPRTQRTGSSR